MRARRGLALVMTVVALATGMTSVAAASPSSASASAKPTICVALVVDGRALGSNVSTSCAKVTKGATGVDVLQAGGHTVGFRSDGLLCTIDGLPKSGCAGVDDTHYWAYFHRAPGSTKWVYSSEGSSTYQPVNDSTEGWVYDDGKALTPENVPYAQICKTKTSPSPTPKPSATTTSSHTPTASATPTQRQTSTPATKPPTSTPAAQVHHHPKSAKPTRSASAASGPASPTPSPSSTSAALAGAIKPPSNHHGWLDLLIGLVIVAALGISAVARFRRSER